jgi:hypothetical protein
MSPNPQVEFSALPSKEERSHKESERPKRKHLSAESVSDVHAEPVAVRSNRDGDELQRENKSAKPRRGRPTQAMREVAPRYSVGDIVWVEARMGTGMNKEGGQGKVVDVNEENGAKAVLGVPDGKATTPFSYNIKYFVDANIRDMRVDAKFMKLSDPTVRNLSLILWNATTITPQLSSLLTFLIAPFPAEAIYTGAHLVPV